MRAMNANVYNLLKDLVGARGFEPRTSCAQDRRATRLRYAPTSTTHEFYFTLINSTSGFFAGSAQAVQLSPGTEPRYAFLSPPGR
jgi:hypothetical protein